MLPILSIFRNVKCYDAIPFHTWNIFLKKATKRAINTYYSYKGQLIEKITKDDYAIIRDPGTDR